MLKNNWWNRLVHKQEVKQLKERKKKVNELLEFGKCDFYEEEVRKARRLHEIMEIHRNIWIKGYRNKNIGPNKYGMFRCEDIATMTDEQVFLGNTHGLFTKTLKFWEEHADTDAFEIIMYQYKMHMISNIYAIRKDLERELLTLAGNGY